MPVLGAVQGQVTTDMNYLAARLAERLGGKAYQLHAPALSDTPQAAHTVGAAAGASGRGRGVFVGAGFGWTGAGTAFFGAGFAGWNSLQRTSEATNNQTPAARRRARLGSNAGRGERI